MKYEEQIDRLHLKMMQFNRGDANRIQHLTKVHRFAQLIARMENVDEHTQFLTECAALVHDIGIRPAEKKYGLSSGRLQEREGSVYARPILEDMNFNEADIDRICYLVGHHHTYTDIDGTDYQILVEADFLVNFYEDKLSQKDILYAFEKIFRTETGKKLCRIAYFPEWKEI